MTAATYQQVWWPAHDEQRYGGDHLPVWDANGHQFVDPDSRQPLTAWDDAVDQVDEPAHVASFGRQVHSKGILGGSEEAGRHIGYLTKYLVKNVSEVVEQHTDAQRRHTDRLHTELSVTPCSPRCAIWLLYGVQPLGVTSKTVPGHCKGRAHRRTTLGLPGGCWCRASGQARRWPTIALTGRRSSRRPLAAAGIQKPAADPSRLVWHKVKPGDPGIQPRAHLLMHAIAERVTWKAEYDRAMLAASEAPPGDRDLSAIPQAA